MNGGRSTENPSDGRSDIFCSTCLWWCLRHVIHFLMICLAKELAWGIQNGHRRVKSIWFLPLCPTFLCTQQRTSSETWLFFGNMAGCFASSGNADLLNHPPTRKMPSIITGSSLLRWLDFFMAFPLLESECSSEKFCLCTNSTIAFSALRFSNESWVISLFLSTLGLIWEFVFVLFLSSHLPFSVSLNFKSHAHALFKFVHLEKY